MYILKKKKHPPDRPRAVLIGLEFMQCLQAARILASRGVPVIAISNVRGHYNCTTRVCEKIVVANTEDDSLIDTLIEIGKGLDVKGVLYPCHDLNVLIVSRHRARLEEYYHVLLPEHEMVVTMIDKVRFYRFAAEKGLPIPETHFVESIKDVERISRNISYPCFLKPSYRTPEWSAFTEQKAFKVEGPDELLNLYREYSPYAEQMIVQQYVEGDETDHYTCNCYFDKEGRPLVTFVSKKVRQWPPKTGQACLAVECENDVVRQETIRLFELINGRGFGYLEMKFDRRTGKYYIIEPNIGRPTGRSATAEKSGVEFLYSMYCDLTGLPLPKNLEQKYNGVKWIHIYQDLRSSYYYWRRGELNFIQWLRSIRGKKAYAIFSLSDPGPFFVGVLQEIRNLAFRKLKRGALLLMTRNGLMSE